MTQNVRPSSVSHVPVTRVLLVDDHPVFALALTIILERDPLLKIIDSVGSGRLALKRYRDLKPDLLLVDLDIPELDGLNLIESIRRTDRDVKILVISSQKAALSAIRCQSAGANGYIEKSVGIPQIQSAVRAVLAGYNCFPVLNGCIAFPHATEILSKREISILKYLARGWSNKQIGDALSISNKTVSTHKNNILTKLGIDNVVDLAQFAKANHLI